MMSPKMATHDLLQNNKIKVMASKFIYMTSPTITFSGNDSVEVGRI